MEMSGDMAGMTGMSGATASPKAPVMDMAGHAAGDMAVERSRAAVEAQLTSAHAHGAATATEASSAMASMGTRLAAKPGAAAPFIHGPDTHGVGNSSVAMVARSRLHEPGSGFDDPAARVLVYADLRSVTPQEDQRTPTREIELHITGNMERYMWSFDGKKYSEARAPIPFAYGERLRLVLVNDTMMEHPIHLHGMWMELENGAGAHQPRKHTVSVKPAERLTVAITADAPGQWAMHCHLLLHMEMGMFRVIEVSSPPQ